LKNSIHIRDDIQLRPQEFNTHQVEPAAAVPPVLDLADAAATAKFPADLPHFVNTMSETAFVLRCSEKSVRRLIDRNLLSASKGLRHIRITRQAILDYLARTSK
jgi:hypothetical protein